MNTLTDIGLQDSFLAEIFIRLDGFSLVEGAKLCIAVSGGADSLALSLALKKYSEQRNVILHAITVDHGIRKESSAEAQQVANIIKQIGIEHTTIQVNLTGNGNIQEQARNLRYDALTKWCHGNSFSVLMLGHNIDDQSETVLMRLFRGSSSKGLSAMREQTSYNSITIFRPMLSIYRRDIEAFLIRNNIAWIDDPSNQNDQYDRNRIRKLINGNVLSDNTESLKLRLYNTALNMQNIEEVITETVKQKWLDVAKVSQLGYIEIIVEEFKKCLIEVQYRIIIKLINLVRGKQQQIRFYKIKNFRNLIIQDNFVPFTLAGCYIKVQAKRVLVLRENSKITETIHLRNQTKSCLWDDRYMVKNAGINWEGWVIKKLDSQAISEIAIELMEIDRYIILSIPALWYDNEIMAIPNLGFFRHESFRKISIRYLGYVP